MKDAIEVIDHLVYAVPELESGVAGVEGLLGARARAGGRHRRWGTHNAIISLGRGVYLEIIAPDPERDCPETVTIFGLDRIRVPRLIGWAAKAPDLERCAARAKEGGVELGTILEGMRQLPDGTALTWRLTDPAVEVAGGVVPFLIDWRDSRHPADDGPAAGRLQSIRAQHPDPVTAQRVLGGMGLQMRIDPGPGPRLIATIRTGAGDIDL